MYLASRIYNVFRGPSDFLEIHLHVHIQCTLHYSPGYVKEMYLYNIHVHVVSWNVMYMYICGLFFMSHTVITNVIECTCTCTCIFLHVHVYFYMYVTHIAYTCTCTYMYM